MLYMYVQATNVYTDHLSCKLASAQGLWPILKELVSLIKYLPWVGNVSIFVLFCIAFL